MIILLLSFDAKIRKRAYFDIYTKRSGDIFNRELLNQHCD